MRPRRAPTARSSSRSSKSAEPGAGRDVVAVGEVSGAHALRGLLRVRPYQPPAPTLRPGVTIFLERDGRRTAARVLSAAPHGRSVLLVGLEGIDGRTAAERLVGTRVLVPADDLPPAAGDEFYWHEVAGFSVETSAGRPLGTIAETFSTGLNDVWVVRDGGREHLIPVIADVVRAIVRPARRVVIEPIPGLLADE